MHQTVQTQSNQTTDLSMIEIVYVISDNDIKNARLFVWLILRSYIQWHRILNAIQKVLRVRYKKLLFILSKCIFSI